VAFAAALVVGTVVPAMAASSGPTAAPPARTAVIPVTAAAATATVIAQPPQHPTTQYEDAIAHAADPNRFVPGGRVTVPFQPKAGDHALVGGALPRSLPAGRESGVMLAAGSGRTESQPTGQSAGAMIGPAEHIGGASVPAAPFTTGPTTLPAKTIATSSAGLRRQVVGFLPYWQLGDPSTTLNDSLLSTIAYFSVGVDRSGNLVKTNSDGSTSTGWGGWTSSQLTTVINQAHQQGTRVVLTLQMFAWTRSDAATQGAFLGDAAARNNLASQAAAAVRDRGADGINLDFEPIASGHAADFTALIRSIRTQLDAIAPGYQLSFDTTAETANYPLEDATAPGGADFVFVMGYDYRTDGASTAGSIAPLNGPIYDLTETVQAYIARVPASKIVLGLPYYGRAWSTVSNAPNSTNQSGTEYGASVSVTYVDAVAVAATNGSQYDPIEHSAFSVYQRQNCTSTYGCVTSWRELYYDDAQSLGEKYDMVNAFGLSGVGMWALGYDGTRPELYQELADKFVNDTTPPVAGILALPPTESQESFTVSWAATDDWSGVASYDVQVSIDGGAWGPWLTATTLTSSAYPGQDGHGYAFRVRATDTAGNVGAWNVSSVYSATPTLAAGGFATTVVDMLNERAAPDPNAQQLASLPIGSRVAITGGPVTAGGYTWYQVTAPITEWNPIAPVLVGVWVASGSGPTPYLAPAVAPNATLVGATNPAAGTTPPAITGAAVNRTLFSPNGDGRLDDVTLTATATGATSWQVTIAPIVAGMPGATVRTIAGLGSAVSATWDGRGDAGSVLPDGTYQLTLTAVDAAPDAATQAFTVTLDATPPVVTAAFNNPTFSPNGDGWADTTTLTWTSSAPVIGTAQLLRGSSVVRAWPIGSGAGTTAGGGTTAGSTSGSTTGSIQWDGRDSHGKGVVDGRYSLRITVQDAAGNQVVDTLVVTVDRTAGLLRWAPGRLVLRGSASIASTTVTYALTRTATTTLTIVGPTGRTVRTAWTAHSQAKGVQRWTWDGHDSAHHVVAAGRYMAVLTVRTALGTTTIMRTVIVQ